MRINRAILFMHIAVINTKIQPLNLKILFSDMFKNIHILKKHAVKHKNKFVYL